MRAKTCLSLSVLFAFTIANIASAAPPAGVKIQSDKRSGRAIAVINRNASRTNISGRAAAAPDLGSVSTLSARITSRPQDSAAIIASDSFIDLYKDAFGIENITSFVPKGSVTDNLGMTHVRYGQTHNGVTVRGAEIISHLNSAGEVVSINGRVLQNLNVKTTPKVNAKKAVAAAQRLITRSKAYKKIDRKFTRKAKSSCLKSTDSNRCFKKRKKQYEKLYRASLYRQPKLYIYNDGFLSNKPETESALAWEFVLSNSAGDGYTFLVNALNGKVFRMTAAGQELHRTIFDCSIPAGDGGCYLDASWAYGSGLYIHGRSEGKPVRGPNPRSGVFHGTTEVDDMYDFIPGLHQYYIDKFNRDGGNDRGGSGNGVNIPFTETRFVVYADAGGGGDLCQTGSAWVAINSAVRVCMGAIVNDIMGHEYAHHVSRHMNYNADGSYNSLIYANESGALNESFSDVIGEAFEYYKTGTADWLQGELGPLGAIRDLAAPSRKTYKPMEGVEVPYPERYNDPNFYCGSIDGGGVHINSSIGNKAAYLASEGGEFNGCKINGIGIEKMEQIWYRALTTYYTKNETFNMAYSSTVQACQDLAAASSLPASTLPVNITLNDCDEVTKALQSVEMDQAGYCSGTPVRDPYCKGSCYRSPFANI